MEEKHGRTQLNYICQVGLNHFNKDKQQIERAPAALVRICSDGVLGSPTPTLLIATTLNS